MNSPSTEETTRAVDMIRRLIRELNHAYSGIDTLPADHPALLVATEADLLCRKLVAKAVS